MRGSPHAHMLLWLEDVPDLNTLEGKKFIDENVSCSLDSPYLELKKYQVHKCTETCYKNKKETPRRCRPNQMMNHNSCNYRVQISA